MSITRPLLIIDIDGVRFGLDAMLVKESLWLPELSYIEEAPHYVVGMFSLRDQFVPVTDLNLRFGHPARQYQLSDQVVVLEQDQRLMGLIVSEVCEVIDLPVEAIHSPGQFDIKTSPNPHLVLGEARVGDEIVTLLDAKQLLSLLSTQGYAEHIAGRFCPEATPEQHAIFRSRAKVLQESVADQEGAHLALAVIELGGEYFGIELETVQEFCEINRPTPIPCCPPQILGAMSLRGNLLTLLDLRAALNLPISDLCGGKVVVARLGDEMIGVVVDDVHDVIYLSMDDLQLAPATLREQRGAEITGTAAYSGKMMVVLDLLALLAREEWIVNETV